MQGVETKEKLWNFLCIMCITYGAFYGNFYFFCPVSDAGSV